MTQRLTAHSLGEHSLEKSRLNRLIQSEELSEETSICFSQSSNDGINEKRREKKEAISKAVSLLFENKLKGCLLNRQKIGCAGQEPRLLKGIVLIYQNPINREFFSRINQALSVSSECQSSLDYIYNPSSGSLFFVSDDVRLIRSQNLDSLSKSSSSLSSLQSTDEETSSLLSEIDANGDLDRSDSLDRKKLEVGLDLLLEEKIFLDAQKSLFFTIRELLESLRVIHTNLANAYERNVGAAYRSFQAGLYGSKLRVCLGVQETAHDIDLCFKMPYQPNNEHVSAAINRAIIRFLTTKLIEKKKGIISLNKVFYKSKRKKISESMEMEVFYLGYGAGLNLTYLVPLRASSDEGSVDTFYFSNFSCEIEDLFVPLKDDFVHFSERLQTLSGADLSMVWEHILAKCFSIPEVVTYNALERILSYCIDGWLPCHGNLTHLTESYFDGDVSVGCRLTQLVAGVHKRLQGSQVSIDWDSELVCLYQLNTLLLALRVYKSDLRERLKSELLSSLVSRDSSLAEIRSIKKLIGVFWDLGILDEGLVLWQIALLASSRVEPTSEMASFLMPGLTRYLLIHIPTMNEWKTSIEAFGRRFASCNETELFQLSEAWSGFFSFLPKPSLKNHCKRLAPEDEIGFGLSEDFCSQLSVSKLAFSQAFVERILSFLSLDSLGQYCFGLFKSSFVKEAHHLASQITKTSQIESLGALSASAATIIPRNVANSGNIVSLLTFFEQLKIKWIDPGNLKIVFDFEKTPSQSLLSLFIDFYIHPLRPEYTLIKDVFTRRFGEKHSFVLTMATSALSNLILSQDPERSKETEEVFYDWLNLAVTHAFKSVDEVHLKNIFDWLKKHPPLEVNRLFSEVLRKTGLKQDLLKELYLHFLALYFAQESRDVKSNSAICSCFKNVFCEFNWAKDRLDKLRLLQSYAKVFLTSLEKDSLFELLEDLTSCSNKENGKFFVQEVVLALLNRSLSKEELFKLFALIFFLKNKNLFLNSFEGIFYEKAPGVMKEACLDLDDFLIELPFYESSASNVFWKSLKKSFGPTSYSQYVIEKIEEASLDQISRAFPLIVESIVFCKIDTKTSPEALSLVKKAPSQFYSNFKSSFFSAADVCLLEESDDTEDLKSFLFEQMNKDTSGLFTIGVLQLNPCLREAIFKRTIDRRECLNLVSNRIIASRIYEAIIGERLDISVVFDSRSVYTFPSNWLELSIDKNEGLFDFKAIEDSHIEKEIFYKALESFYVVSSAQTGSLKFDLRSAFFSWMGCFLNSRGLSYGFSQEICAQVLLLENSQEENLNKDFCDFLECVFNSWAVLKNQFDCDGPNQDQILLPLAQGVMKLILDPKNQEVVSSLSPGFDRWIALSLKGKASFSNKNQAEVICGYLLVIDENVFSSWIETIAREASKLNSEVWYVLYLSIMKLKDEERRYQLLKDYLLNSAKHVRMLLDMDPSHLQPVVALVSREYVGKDASSLNALTHMARTVAAIRLNRILSGIIYSNDYFNSFFVRLFALVCEEYLDLLEGAGTIEKTSQVENYIRALEFLAFAIEPIEKEASVQDDSVLALIAKADAFFKDVDCKPAVNSYKARSQMVIKLFLAKVYSDSPKIAFKSASLLEPGHPFFDNKIATQYNIEFAVLVHMNRLVMNWDIIPMILKIDSFGVQDLTLLESCYSYYLSFFSKSRTIVGAISVTITRNLDKKTARSIYNQLDGLEREACAFKIMELMWSSLKEETQQDVCQLILGFLDFVDLSSADFILSFQNYQTLKNELKKTSQKIESRQARKIKYQNWIKEGLDLEDELESLEEEIEELNESAKKQTEQIRRNKLNSDEKMASFFRLGVEILGKTTREKYKKLHLRLGENAYKLVDLDCSFLSIEIEEVNQNSRNDQFLMAKAQELSEIGSRLNQLESNFSKKTTYSLGHRLMIWAQIYIEGDKSSLLKSRLLKVHDDWQLTNESFFRELDKLYANFYEDAEKEAFSNFYMRLLTLYKVAYYKEQDLFLNNPLNAMNEERFTVVAAAKILYLIMGIAKKMEKKERNLSPEICHFVLSFAVKAKDSIESIESSLEPLNQTLTPFYKALIQSSLSLFEDSSYDTLHLLDEFKTLISLIEDISKKRSSLSLVLSSKEALYYQSRLRNILAAIVHAQNTLPNSLDTEEKINRLTNLAVSIAKICHHYFDRTTCSQLQEFVLEWMISRDLAKKLLEKKALKKEDYFWFETIPGCKPKALLERLVHEMSQINPYLSLESSAYTRAQFLNETNHQEIALKPINLLEFGREFTLCERLEKSQGTGFLEGSRKLADENNVSDVKQAFHMKDLQEIPIETGNMWTKDQLLLSLFSSFDFQATFKALEILKKEVESSKDRVLFTEIESDLGSEHLTKRFKEIFDFWKGIIIYKEREILRMKDQGLDVSEKEIKINEHKRMIHMFVGEWIDLVRVNAFVGYRAKDKFFSATKHLVHNLEKLSLYDAEMKKSFNGFMHLYDLIGEKFI